MDKFQFRLQLSLQYHYAGWARQAMVPAPPLKRGLTGLKHGPNCSAVSGEAYAQGMPSTWRMQLWASTSAKLCHTKAPLTPSFSTSLSPPGSCFQLPFTPGGFLLSRQEMKAPERDSASSSSQAVERVWEFGTSQQPQILVSRKVENKAWAKTS